MSDKRQPRRLFSLDSIKSRTTSESSSESSPAHARKHSRYPTLDSVVEDDQSAPLEPPVPRSTSRPASPNFKGKARFLPSVLTASSVVEADEGAALPRTPSGARWENIRQHVMPAPQRSGAVSPFHGPQASTSSAHSSTRSTTPKPSRIAQRFGFKHVVEKTKDVGDGNSRAIIQEIQRACLAASHSPSPSSMKSKPEPSYTLPSGSTLHLPFILNSQAGTPLPTAKVHDLRRPQSQMSLHTLAQPSGPSLKMLYQTLLFHANQSSFDALPCEAQVLSTLMIAFTSSNQNAVKDEEHWFAAETFDIITKNWVAEDEASSLRRCAWCIQVALVLPISSMRTRILSFFESLTAQNDIAYPITSPASLRSIAQGAFMVFPNAGPDEDLLKRTISRAGQEVDTNVIEEEFNALFIDTDVPETIRGAVILQALAEAMENTSPSSCRWLLHNLLQEYWLISPFDDITFSPLLAAITARRLRTTVHVFLSLVKTENAVSAGDTHTISMMLDTRVIPELNALSSIADVEDVKRDTARIVLEVLSLEDAPEEVRWANSLITHWYRSYDEWRNSFQEALKHVINTEDWPHILRLTSSLLHALLDDIRKQLAMFIVPMINERLVEDPPPYPCIPLTSLLDSLSQLYPPVFYKPLFACAASSKEFAVVNHMRTLAVLAKYLADFWTRDAEMMSIALTSGDIKAGQDPKQNTEEPDWAKARLGQSILYIEVIGRLQEVRRLKDNNKIPEAMFVAAVKFAFGLDARLAVLLTNKEKKVLIAPSQRLLLIVLFREMRLLTRSLKNTTWLPKVISWLMQHPAIEESGFDFDGEVDDSLTLIRGLYAAAQDSASAGAAHLRRSTVLFAPGLARNASEDAFNTAKNEVSRNFSGKEQLLKSIGKGFVSRGLKLLVTVSAMISPTEFKGLCGIMWEYYMESEETSTLPAVCFLLMQAAEKCPLELLATIEVDLQSSNAIVRLRAVQKLGALISGRFQIMSQNFILDRTHRPFKLAKAPLAFMPTDMGSPRFVLDTSQLDMKDKLPLELRKRLAEIGWADDDASVDQQHEWIQTPMSLLPSMQLDRIDPTNGEMIPSSTSTPSPASSPRKSPFFEKTAEEAPLLRRNSSSGGPLYGTKRKAIFVPMIGQIFPRLSGLAFDTDFTVASQTRNVLLDIMRSDSLLLSRPIFDLLTGDRPDVDAAISTFRSFLHIRRILPPSMAHTVWNHLAGLLKYLVKQVESTDTLHTFALAVPILAKLVPQVSDMNVRELRRAKLETFLIPSGRLWFSDSTPDGPMFPRQFDRRNPFVDASSQIADVTMIRMAQNNLLLALLRRNTQDVQLVRKSMHQLELPFAEHYERSLELRDYVPLRMPRADDTSFDALKNRGLSLMLARSHIPLVAQIFRALSRHLNDKAELATLVDGLNRILLVHGNDIGIVTQVLIALMVASTRFRRLFASSGGYALFMPAVLKVYAEAEQHMGIRLAIEYAVNRFYAHNTESFVFQSLDVAANMVALPEAEGKWIAQHVYHLLATLSQNMLTAFPDLAGIHNANKAQEQETLMLTTVEEKPQTVLASMGRTPSSSSVDSKEQVTFNFPQEYEAGRLSLDDFVRLILTVIAHDLSIARAEKFMRCLRYLTPHLYRATQAAATVLQHGIDALGIALTKLSLKSKTLGDPAQMEDSLPTVSAVLDTEWTENSKKNSDVLTMQLDYLAILVAFGEAGGTLSSASTERALDLVKTIMRDVRSDKTTSIMTAFLVDFTRAFLNPDRQRPVKAVNSFLRQISPLIAAYSLTMDFTGVFEEIRQICHTGTYSNDPAFVQLVGTQICGPCLAACEIAASDNLLFSVPSRLALIDLLVEVMMSVRGGADSVLPEIENRVSTYEFLVGLIQPVVAKLGTGINVDIKTTAPSWFRKAEAQSWTRLLFYVMDACHASFDPVGPKVREKSDWRRSLDKSSGTSMDAPQLAAFVFSLQVLKLILIRGETQLAASLPDVWDRVSVLLKTVLADGDGRFSLQRATLPHSASSSPRNSMHFESWPSGLMIPPSTPTLGNGLQTPPRVVDYCLWSLFEFLCLHRTPLWLHMRRIVQETLATMEQSHPGHGSNISHRVSSAFSKPRRLSGMFLSASASSTPEASPMLGPSRSSLRTPNIKPLSLPPMQPSPERQHGIVHLGLVEDTGRDSRASPGMAIRTVRIHSFVLIRATYQRIRVVQSRMGYSPRHSAMLQDDDCPSNWTTDTAIQKLLEETELLVEEFEEANARANESAVFVDAPL